jgi:hypothetical protein
MLSGGTALDNVAGQPQAAAQPQGQKQIQVNFPANLQGGVYSNNVVISHTKEEFILDFMMISPPAGSVVSRIIMNPGHMKRFIEALQANLKNYEGRFGHLEASSEPKSSIGFHP